MSEQNSQSRDHSQPEAHRPKNLRIWVLLAAILLVIVFLVGFVPRHERNKKIDDAAKQRESAPPTLEVTKVQHAKGSARLTLPGTITAVVEAPIYARASGYISKRYVDIGDRVRTGQLLALIDAPDLDQQVDQARAALLQAQSVLGQNQAQLKLASVTTERYRVLVAKGVLSRQDGDTQEANFEVAQANVKAAENSVTGAHANLDRLLKLQSYEKVTAPFNGIVTVRNVDVGTLISANGGGQGNAGNPGATSQGGPMFSVAQSDRMRVFIGIPEAYSAFVKVGDTSDVAIGSLPGQKFMGKITRTSGSVDPGTRTLLTEVQIDNGEGKLLPGMYGVITFENVRTAPPLVIPSDALISRAQGNMVAVVRDNIVHLQAITVGRDYGAQLEVLSGLNEGDSVAINPSDVAREGAKVTPHEAPAQASGGAPSPGGQTGNNAQGQPQSSGQNSSGKKNPGR
jgi:multidrug efflux pump subunit AcrA (membrane-fusion protein)